MIEGTIKLTHEIDDIWMIEDVYSTEKIEYRVNFSQENREGS